MKERLESSNREVNAGISTSQRSSLRWIIAGSLALSALLYSRIHYHCGYLFNWDGVQFALSLEKYDISLHQPHPPGYLLYCFTLRIWNLLFHDPNLSMITLNILATAGALYCIALLVLELIPNNEHRFWLAAGAMALYLTNPVCWLYSSVSEIYAVEGFFASLFLYQIVASMRKPQMLVYASATLAIAGGFRPTTELLLLPVYMISFLKKDRKTKLISLAVFFILNVLWLSVLAFLTHGVGQLVSGIVGQLSGSIQSRQKGLWQYPLGRLAILIIQAITLPILAAIAWRSPQLKFSAGQKLLLASLVFPLIFFTFVLLAKDGYLLLIIPILIVLSVVCLGSLYRNLLIILAVILISCFWNYSIFVHPSYYPGNQETLSILERFVNELNSPNKHAIRHRESQVGQFLHAVEALRPAHVFVFLDKPDAFPDWRTAMYYLPDDVVAVRHDGKSASIAQHHHSYLVRRNVSLKGIDVFLLAGIDHPPFPMKIMDFEGSPVFRTLASQLPERFKIGNLEFNRLDGEPRSSPRREKP